MYEIKIDRSLSMVAMVLAFGLLLGSASEALMVLMQPGGLRAGLAAK